uniref:VWFA domain-containing protein n=1 Tax=Macrostomum lignano TaxID=282301 RepID=A0A1I8J873_9PLAT
MSQTAQVLANFDDLTSLSDFNSAVDRLTMSSERAEISKGIKLARESVLNKARAAPTPRLLALVKDRQCAERITGSSDAELASIKSEVAVLKLTGNAVHAIGIGGLWNSRVLKAIFGTSYLLFKNNNKAMESVKSLNIKMCLPPTCKHSGQTVKPETCFAKSQHVLTFNVAGAFTSSKIGVCRQHIARSFQSCTEKQSCSKMERSLGSCQADGKLAILETLQFFDRKKQSCVTYVEKHKVDCSGARECKDQVADVVIMLDKSGSIHSKYHTVANSAKTIVESLNLGEKNVRIGVVTFNGFSTYVKSIMVVTDLLEMLVGLGDEFDKSKILTKIEKSRTKSGSFSTPKGEKNVFKAVVIITDGSSNDAEVLYQTVSEIKNDNVTLYAVGVGKVTNYELRELNLITSPESDKNLFVFEKFEQLKPWAEKFSQRLCMELKPPNPKFCDADVQFKSISLCRFRKMHINMVNFKYDTSKRCIKHFKSEIKTTCVDPIDGSDHLEGESWTNMCHEFRCDSSGNTILPTSVRKCVAADFSCKPIGAAPFRCRNIDGEERENCQCIDKDGEAVLVVDNPN